MRVRFRVHRYLALAALGAVLLVLAGCPAAQQRAPEPGTDVRPTPAAPAPVVDFGALQDQFDQFIKGVGVPGYRRADTILIGNTALIGLQLDAAGAAGGTAAPGATTPGATPGTAAPGATPPGAAASPETSARMVADRVVAGRLGVSRALVTVDPAQVTRIQQLVQEFRGGVPASDRIDEIAAIVKAVRGSPATTATPSR